MWMKNYKQIFYYKSKIIIFFKKFTASLYQVNIFANVVHEVINGDVED